MDQVDVSDNTLALFDPKLDLGEREVSGTLEEYSPENDPNTIPRSGKSQDYELTHQKPTPNGIRCLI